MLKSLSAHLTVLGVKNSIIGTTLCIGKKTTITAAANGDVRLNYNKVGRVTEEPDTLALRIKERLS